MWEQMRELLLVLLLGLPLAVGVAGLGGYVLARRALAPIEQMTERARTITAERLADRLPVAHPDDEMGRLASVFNETLARLESSFAQMRQFTADVSHELRTPLTSIRSVGEVGLRGHRDEQRLPRHHREHARGGGSPRRPRRSAAHAVAGRDRPGAAVARDRRPAGAGRGRGAAPRRAGRGEAAADRGRAPRRARRARRQAGAAPRAHQPGGQRHQVLAARRRRAHPHLRDGGVGDLRRDRQRPGRPRRRPARGSSIASTGPTRATASAAPASACRLQRAPWRPTAGG